MNNDPKGNYAEVNGLKMYYEIHGTGQPLVLLHGAYMSIDAMGERSCRPLLGPVRSSPSNCRGMGAQPT